MKLRAVSLLLLSLGVLAVWALLFIPKAVLVPDDAQNSGSEPIERGVRDTQVKSEVGWISHPSAIVEAKSLKVGVDLGEADSLCRMASLMMYCGRLDADEARARLLPSRMLGGGVGMGVGEGGLVERRAYCAGMDGDIASVFEMFRKAAVAGNHHAQTVFLSGILFLENSDGAEGLGEQYLSSAKEVLRTSIDGGNRDVVFMLADAYAGRSESRALGLVVNPNPAASKHLYQLLLEELDGSADPEADISRMMLGRRLQDLGADGLSQSSGAPLGDYPPRLKASSSALDVSRISNPVGRIVGECR